MLRKLKMRILIRIVQNNLASWIRDIASLGGAWLLAQSIPTDSVQHAIAGSLMLAFGFLGKFIDQFDGPSNFGVQVWNLLIGPRVRNISNSIARWLILTMVGALGGLHPEFDWSTALDGDVVTAVTAIASFFLSRVLRDEGIVRKLIKAGDMTIS